MLCKPINLAVVDDHALFRKVLKNYLSEQKNVNVVVQASDMLDLFTQLRGHSVDILVMDIFMPGTNGYDAIKTLHDEYPLLKILVLSMSIDMDMISELLDMGIYGYISKADEPEELLLAIKSTSENRLYRNRLFTEALYWNKQNNMHDLSEHPSAALNERDKKILQLIWEEKSNKEIADELFLGVRSVEKIRQDLKEKVGVKSTIGLLKFAIKKKFIRNDMRIPSLLK
jgi:DNA-binding NarL/FixJ family response regulator